MLKNRELGALLGRTLVPEPGVCELLLHLKMRSIPAAVASSSPLPVIDVVVDGLGLRTSFAGLFSASMVGR